MTLSADDAAWLAELRLARRRIIRGDTLAGISSGGRSISVAQLPPLDALKIIDAEIDRLEQAEAGGSGRKRGALKFNIRS